MKSIFIVKEEQIFYSSHYTMPTGHFVNKIKVVSNKKEEKELQNAYKLSLWERFKFFGVSLLPRERLDYNIVPLKNGKYDIQKS